MKIYCRGRIVEQQEAVISANDHGFLYGAALFETFRTFGGKPFLLEEHLARLLAGCEAYGIVPDNSNLVGRGGDSTRLRQVIGDLLAQNALPDAVFRYTISSGEMPPGLPAADYARPTEIIHVRPLPESRETFRIHILNTRRTQPEVFPRPKSAQYVNSLLARRELRALGARPGDEGLMLTPDGWLSEGTVSNLFLVAADDIATPPLSAHILPGITRQKVLALAESLGLNAAERELRVDDLLQADAIFTTNSVQGLAPAGTVLDTRGATLWEKDSARNPLVKKLLAAYARCCSLQAAFT